MEENIKKVYGGRILVDSNDIIDLNTGECLSMNSEIDRDLIYEIIREIEQSKNTEKAEMRYIRKLINRESMSVKYKMNWGNNKNAPMLFCKEYKVFKREVYKNMSLQEIGLMSVFSSYLEQGSNKVIIDGESPTNKKLGEIVNLSAKSVSIIISNLKNKNLIHTQGSGMGREIFVNPMYSFNGRHLDIKTYNLFFNKQ